MLKNNKKTPNMVLTVVGKFRFEYSFLSNFYSVNILYKGIMYPSAEHCFQACKTSSSINKIRISHEESPAMAKKLGRMYMLRSNWERIKDRVMLTIIRKKFEQNEDLLKKLIELKGVRLVEGNTWHDNYWGNCTCWGCRKIKGKNKLGKMLMELCNA
jgi:hypothetical protein